MKKYLVGGAVRDRLLGFPVTERDWVVIGETPESMMAQNYRPVGKDFPVFLHPDTHEEYALARTERKTAPGYKGFAIHATPDVTLEEDLKRRDLTINAMAISSDGKLIDPYGGRKDLENRLLRHVSPAFSEDPVRVLRVARFAARYGHLGFAIAAETRELIEQMVGNGEVDYLIPERVWAETVKALSEKSPTAYFETLRSCGALAVIFPELDALFGVPQPATYHPEIDTGLHSMMVLRQAAKLSDKALVRFAALLHDLGKAATPREQWPHHHGHEQLGLPILEHFCQRLRVPKQFNRLAQHVMRYHSHCHRAFALRPATIVDMLAAMGMFKEHADLNDFLLACTADARGRAGLENSAYPQAGFLHAAQQAGMAVDTAAVLGSNLRGPEIGKAIRELRIRAIKSLQSSMRNE